MKKSLLMLSFLILTLCSAAAVMPVLEMDVRNLGPGEIDRSAVLSHIRLEEGSDFSREILADDVRRLERSGLFSYVAVSVEERPGGLVVYFDVEPRLRLRRLKIRGVDELSLRKLRDEIGLEPGAMVDDGILASAVQRARAWYREKHFPFAEFDWEINPIAGTSLADVTLRVSEGRRSRVRRVKFPGRESISRRTLIKAIPQRRRNWLSWITGRGGYDPKLLEDNRAAVRNVYLDRGYLEVKVGEPRVEILDKGNVVLTIPVEEGPVYRLADIGISGADLFSDEELLTQLRSEPGMVASLQILRQDADNLRNAYGRRGYVDTRVRHDLQLNPRRQTADVVFLINEGHEAYIRDISIRGNVRTRDKVIRRELAVEPGDLYNEPRVRASERRLFNLGYFEDVRARRHPTIEPDSYDLSFDVVEKPTGQFMLGAGFSSVDDIVGFLELSQGNFDLFNWPTFTGGGQKLSLRTQLGTKRNDVEVSFTEPWLFDRKLSLGVDFFRHDRRFLSDDFDQKNIGGSVSLGKAVGRFSRLSLTYSLQEIEIYNVSSGASQLIRDEKGSRTKSALQLALSHDTRDNFFVPTAGARSRAAVTLAGGPLAGDTDIYQLETRTSRHFPLWFSHVFSLRGSAAVVERYGASDRVPLYDRLFMGGARTLRGFRYRDVGPKDERGEPIGGRSSAWASAEYNVPVVNYVRLAAFYDIGMVWPDAYQVDSNFNSSAGVAVKLDIPGFPLRLYYGWPLETDEFNEQPGGRFDFLIGYPY